MNFLKQFWKQFKEAAAKERIPAPAEPLRNLTPRAQTVCVLAQKHAIRLKHDCVGTEHLLLGLFELGQGVAFNVMERLKVDFEKVRSKVESLSAPSAELSPAPPFAPSLKRVFDLANEERKALNHTYLGTEHLLLGILRDGDGIAANVLKSSNVDLDHTRKEILRELDPNFVPGEEH